MTYVAQDLTIQFFSICMAIEQDLAIKDPQLLTLSRLSYGVILKMELPLWMLEEIA